jgi:sporulation protein YlmC with PRC-barrel domain
MLEFDPGIFKGERLFAVPTAQLRLGSDDQLVYNMTRDKLEQAAVPQADWNKAWQDHDYLGRMDKVWGVTQPSNDERAYRVSDLLGKDVNSPSGKDIGDLKDLVINMATQKVHYAVLAFDPSWTAPEKNFAFPLSAFNLTADKDELVLNVDKAKVQAMKSFDDSRLANLNDPVWVADVDRYFVTILPVVVAVKPEDVFARLDHDKNGWLDKTEVKDSADVERNWARLDTDKDGRISKSEFTSRYTADAGSPAAKKTGS